MNKKMPARSNSRVSPQACLLEHGVDATTTHTQEAARCDNASCHARKHSRCDNANCHHNSELQYAEHDAVDATCHHLLELGRPEFARSVEVLAVFGDEVKVILSQACRDGEV